MVEMRAFIEVEKEQGVEINLVQLQNVDEKGTGSVMRM